ncbi:MAG: 50S ribosome-binding GTPase [Oligoflexia bacterium]|nr:50S ribosome-binding GTPase [Oligoflexia bacterium]
MFLYQDGPIIAVSTSSASNAAIAVIRMSGFDNIENYQKFFSIDLNKIIPRRVYLSDLIENNRIIDSVVVTFYKTPNSYTAENVIELSVHGNRLNVQRILDLFLSIQTLSLKSGPIGPAIRLANPGEFTYRALKNKKISLSEVEGLDLVLNASSTYALEQGMSILRGELHKNYEILHQLYLKLRMSIELNIDFSEDVGEEEAKALLVLAYKNFFSHIETLHLRTRGYDQGLLSPDIVLFGAVNAGKSTLFNSILRMNRSIVSDIPGTTRDYVSENISIDGVNYRLIDTAGLRDKIENIDSIIENEGIRRGLEIIRNAFVKILVVNPFIEEKFADEIFKMDLDLIVFTHNDLDLSGHAEKVKDYLNKSGDKLKSNISFKSGPIGPLLKEILDYTKDKYNLLASENPILIERHRDLINRIYIASLEVKKLFDSDNNSEVAIIASELVAVGNLISELIGVVTPSDVLNSIFKNFCIGK